MKAGDLAYAKVGEILLTKKHYSHREFLGIIIEVKDIMVAVLKDDKIIWYGKPGIQIIV